MFNYIQIKKGNCDFLSHRIVRYNLAIVERCSVLRKKHTLTLFLRIESLYLTVVTFSHSESVL